MVKISAFIICRNEEASIGRALESLSFADELIVVDAESTDRTPKICAQYTDRIFQRAWTNFADQRNFALAQLSHPWVFALDADEVCSPELISWMNEFKVQGPAQMARGCHTAPIEKLIGPPKKDDVELFEIARMEFLDGKPVTARGGKSFQWRFFVREGTRYEGKVHEYPVVQGRIMRLDLPIFHYPRHTIVHQMAKINAYSQFEAQERFARGERRGVIYMALSGFSKFLRTYFNDGWVKQGVRGFIHSVLAATNSWLRQAKLYALWRTTK